LTSVETIIVSVTFCGRPFVKRFALCYRTVVCLSVLSVCDVGVLWPNGSTDQDETWHAGRPRPWPHCVRWGPSSPSPKRNNHPIFGPYLLWPNGCMDQDATWYFGREVGFGPSDIVLDGDPAPPPQKRDRAPANFRRICLVAKRLDASRCHLIWR